MGGQARQPDSNVALLEEFMQAWNAHDLDVLMALMTDDCVFYASSGPGPTGAVHEGPVQVRDAYAEIFTTFPDARWTYGSHVVADGRGFSEWTFTGSRADGDQVETRGCDLFVLRDGKIAVKDSFRKNVTS
jgi:ketosteroid isomerase-like protein